MQVTIYPGTLSGSVTPPPSKSQSHRLVLAAALAEGESRITKLGRSRDITATLDCVRALGAEVRLAGDTAVISGIREGPEELPQMDCGESGSTLRFLIPVALAAAGGGVFYGRGRLMQRPQEPYFAIFREKGIAFSQNGDTLTVRGSLTPGIYRLPGNVSSQFITGLLYALPLLDGDSEILLTTELESAPYVDMTLDALERAGVRVVSGAKGWHVPGNQRFRPLRMQVEGDWSQAAFFAAARFPGDGIRLLGLDPASRQGDRCLLDMETRLRQPGRAVLDVSGCPDLVPALAAMAAFREDGVTEITGAGRLRIKESDRLSAVTAVLGSLGARVEEHPDGLTILGSQRLPGGVTVDVWNDHRIAMMAAVAATRCAGPVTVTGAQAVEKSYPGFWEDLRALGARLEVQP